MKKLLTVCLLLATTFAVKAQNVSFEETVKYIQEKINCCTVDYEDGTNRYSRVEINKNGNIKFIRSEAQNLTFNLFDLNKRGDCKCGISQEGTYVEFWYESNRCKRIKLTTIPESNRVYKAFLHVLTLCKKEKDPFDN